MRPNQIKQYYDTLSDTTVDVNSNSSDTLAFSDKSNKSKDNNDETFNSSSHTNSITSNITQKLLSRLQHINNNNKAITLQ